MRAAVAAPPLDLERGTGTGTTTRTAGSGTERASTGVSRTTPPSRCGLYSPSLEVPVRRAAFLLAALALPGSALAESGVRFGADVEYGFPLDAAVPPGIGVGLKIGYSIGFTIGRLIPEIGVTYYTNGEMTAPKVGGALFLGKGLEIGVYSHLVVPFAPTVSQGAFGFDAGVALDVRAIPKVDFGVHFGGQFIGETDESIPSPDEALIVGAHIGFTI